MSSRFRGSKSSSLIARQALASLVAVLVFAFISTLAPSAFGADDPDAAAKKKAEKECTDAAQTAQQACAASGSTAGMTAGQAQQSQQLQQQQTANNQATQAAGAQQAQQCKLQADMSKIMSGLSALTGAACLAMVGSCKSACNGNGKKEPTDDPNPSTDGGEPKANLQTAKMKQVGKQCDGLAMQGTMAMAQAGLMLAASMMNNKCAQLSATSPTPAPDCTNPEYAKTSILCVCQNDPKNAMCIVGQQFPSGIMTSNGPQGPSSPLGAESATASDGALVGGFQGPAKTASGSATADGGGGGGGAGGKGLQAINGDGAASGPGASANSVIQGTSGGSGSGASAGGIPSGGGGGGGGRSGGGGGGAGKMNLQGFLPRQAGRNIAGMSIPAIHGITGPLGPSIFEKVSNQYQQQRKNLIQDR